MPELPEVEVTRRNLTRWIAGKKIVHARAEKSRVLGRIKPSVFEDLLGGQTVVSIVRRGKWLRIELKNGAALYSHLGMTGKWVQSKEPRKYERIRFECKGAAPVRYLDPRMFGRLVPAPDGEILLAWKLLGPDPLVDGINVQKLRERFARTGRPIKEVLLDQSVLAGVGNIQAAEAMWRAKIHPRKRAYDLDAREVGRLAKGIESSIADSLAELDRPEIQYVEEGGDNPFSVYAKQGQPCPRCRAKLVRIVQAGRSTVFCPKCQRR